MSRYERSSQLNFTYAVARVGLKKKKENERKKKSFSRYPSTKYSLSEKAVSHPDICRH